MSKYDPFSDFICSNEFSGMLADLPTEDDPDVVAALRDLGLTMATAGEALDRKKPTRRYDIMWRWAEELVAVGWDKDESVWAIQRLAEALGYKWTTSGR